MSDLIDRQAAIDCLGFTWSEDAIRNLPPAQPEPMKIDLSRCSEENWERIKKEWANTPITAITAEPERIKGHWIDAVIPNDSGGLPVIVCDKCNTFFPLQFGDSHNFCPNCGADMRGEQYG